MADLLKSIKWDSSSTANSMARVASGTSAVTQISFKACGTEAKRLRKRIVAGILLDGRPCPLFFLYLIELWKI